MSGQPCPACGHDEFAPVAGVWSMFFTEQPPSQNEHVNNVGGARWKYKKLRDAWQRRFVCERIPKATGKRRITFERIYGGRMKERDHANYVGGLKLVVDSMVRAGLLVDDNSKSFEGVYRQRKATSDLTGLRVVVEEFA